MRDIRYTAVECPKFSDIRYGDMSATPPARTARRSACVRIRSLICNKPAAVNSCGAVLESKSRWASVCPAEVWLHTATRRRVVAAHAQGAVWFIVVVACHRREADLVGCARWVGGAEMDSSPLPTTEPSGRTQGRTSSGGRTRASGEKSSGATDCTVHVTQQLLTVILIEDAVTKSLKIVTHFLFSSY